MLVEMKEVVKSLGSFVLDGISMELPAGYIMGLIGPNGAGKTSLIHILLGLYQPESGSVLIDGDSYEDKEQEIREKLGYVLLEDLFDEVLTLRQNGDKFGKFYQHYHAEVLEKYLLRFSLEGRRRYRELSRGERLKFQFAFALSHDAKLLVLDEPTGNFDEAFREEFFKVLKEFIADGDRSVILSTHLTDDLDRIADYICYLEKGKLIFAGDIESLHEKYRLVTGEEYKIKLLPREDILHMEKGTYGARALIRYHARKTYDALAVTIPTIEEFMYFMTKRGKKG